MGYLLRRCWWSRGIEMEKKGECYYARSANGFGEKETLELHTQRASYLI